MNHAAVDPESAKVDDSGMLVLRNKSALKYEKIRLQTLLSIKTKNKNRI